ncbi:MAG TPA: DUF1697 domain-containing protein [Phenylobacterium sp.]
MKTADTRSEAGLRTREIQIALLRGVMPTGSTKVPMAELRALLQDLGFQDVRTLLATGNAVFRSGKLGGPKLETLLEKEIAAHIGPRLDVMVRDLAAFRKILAAAPFPAEAEAMPSKVLGTVFKTPPSPDQAHAFEAAITGPEKAKVVGDVAWVVHSNGVAASNVTPQVYRRAFGKLSGTARNWNTFGKILAAAEALA